MDDSDKHSLISASVLRSKICADAKLSKRAAALLRRECDALASRLLTRAVASTSGPIDAQDLWEALMSDGSYSWLIDRLGFWECDATPDDENSVSKRQRPLPIPPDVPLPLPPQGLTPDSDLLPRLLWLRAPQPRTAMHGIGAIPLHEALLESRGDPATAQETSSQPVSLHHAFLSQ